MSSPSITPTSSPSGAESRAPTPVPDQEARSSASSTPPPEQEGRSAGDAPPEVEKSPEEKERFYEFPFPNVAGSPHVDQFIAQIYQTMNAQCCQIADWARRLDVFAQMQYASEMGLLRDANVVLHREIERLSELTYQSLPKVSKKGFELLGDDICTWCEALKNVERDPETGKFTSVFCGSCISALNKHYRCPDCKENPLYLNMVGEPSARCSDCARKDSSKKRRFEGRPKRR